MKFNETALKGAFLIAATRHEDERGSFRRIWSRKEFIRHGLSARWIQSNISRNPRKATLRGMHMQRAPHTETKLVTCLQGAMYDVIVDLRPDSLTYLQWVGFELTEKEPTALYIPEGLAHGFITLAVDTVVHYQISEEYHPESAVGVRYDDPTLKIDWPLEPEVIAPRDQAWSAIMP